MNAYALLVAGHVLAGTLALVTFWMAALLRKGSPSHRRTGQVYLLAMCAIVATGAPMAVARLLDGHPVTAAFLGYLVVITATGMWGAWRAIRDRASVQRYTGPVFVVLAALSLASGCAVFALGVNVQSPLLTGFSLVGVAGGLGMIGKRLRRERLASDPRWWMREHYTSMLGNGIATHIAFLGIGLPRLLPSVSGTASQYVAWFAPIGVAIIAKLILDRRWGSRPRHGIAVVASRP